jgi:4-hydroxybenzoate polyprenyltransferase
MGMTATGGVAGGGRPRSGPSGGGPDADPSHGPMQRIGALILASHPEPGLAVTVIAVALAASSGRNATGIVAVGLAVAAGQLSVGWHNDWLDALRDRRAGRADKPVARDAVPRSVVRLAASLALAACIPLSLSSGWRAGSAHLVAVALAWAYNGGLKATVWSWAPYAGAFALLVAFVSLGLPGSPWPPWWAAAAGALLGTGAHLVNAATDIDDDRATGVRGLPLRLGYRRSVVLAALLLLAASILIAVGPRHLGWPVVGLPVAVTLVAVGLSGPSRPGSRRLFRVAMAVALVDAAMLVAQGHRL